MSYILDALKRSEQERHQGQMPTLTGNDTLLLLNQRRSQRWPYILIGVLLLNAMIYAFFQWRSVSTPPPPISEVSKDALHKVESSQPSAMVQSPNPVSSQVLSNTVVVDESKDTASNIETGTNDEGLVYVDGGLLIQPSQKSVSLSETPNEDLPIAFESTKPNETGVSESLSVYHDVPQLSEMDQQTQGRVPILKFNSHIYSDTPSARRVMINNNYLREGQSFSGLEVLEIGETNLVLSLSGVQFKIPVLRDWNGL